MRYTHTSNLVTGRARPMRWRRSARRLLVTPFALAFGGLLGVLPARAQAQWVTTHEQFYLQAPHNWVFRDNYQGADRLFNAFDYGHAILYETLWTKPGAPASQLEEHEYDFLTKKVLVRPPRVPLEEGAIEIRYAQLAPEAKAMFEWAHILHRQIYDVLADERLDQSAKDREVQRLIDYYKSRRDLAFSSQPKSMKLMQEQPYSLAFRQKYPKFNGLIWAYHWMQVGLYEPLLVGKDLAARQSGVRATVARFWQMLADPPRTFPYQMPMTPAIAPEFARRYPEAAIIFDNLHSMHDVISDILANDAVPRGSKRAEILRAARRFRDDTSYVMTRQAWLTMAGHMGIENMGGPSVGFLPTLPTPTVSYGAVMSHDDRTGEMTGFKYGQATAGAHEGHQAAATRGAPAAGAAADSSRAAHGAEPGVEHGGAMHERPHQDSAHAAHAQGYSQSQVHSVMELHERMLADPVIRNRIRSDTALRRMLDEVMAGMPAEHRAMHEARGGATKEARPSTSRPAARSSARGSRPAAKRRATPAPRPAPAAADPHAGHGPPAATPPTAPAKKKPADAHIHTP